jgi:serine/threonine protein phosphatase 1
MIASIRRLLRTREAAPLPAIPEGERVYAIGDIHGRLDLFSALVDAIDADDATHPPANTTVILLGDLVDRGPDSAGVLDLARQWGERRRVRILAGNHEEMMLGALESIDVLRRFVHAGAGGRETLLSFGISPEDYDRSTWEELLEMARAAIDAGTLAFLNSFEELIAIGDYCFVHAGIRPGVALGEQTGPDLRWIREPFLSAAGSHGSVIVHGHTIDDDPQIRPNRIGLDTGAYASGRLTAIGLEGTARWLLTAQEQDGVVGILAQNAV